MARWTLALLAATTMGCAMFDGDDEEVAAREPLPAEVNPEYAWWADFQPGAWVVLAERSDLDDPEALDREIRMELKELDEERALIEIRTGEPRLTSEDVDVEEREILRYAAPGERPVLIQPEFVTVRAAGKSFPTQQYRVLVREGSPDVPIEKKELIHYWVTDQVPGGVVRMTYKPEQAFEPLYERTLVSFGTGGRVEQQGP